MTTSDNNIVKISIGSGDVRQIDGLYSLNDLHKLSGGEKTHQPSNFVRNSHTQGVIEVLARSSDMRNIINVLPKVGTYICKELAYSYAMWVSPEFEVLVIRAFESMQSVTDDIPQAVRNFIKRAKVDAGCKAEQVAEEFLTREYKNVSHLTPAEAVRFLDREAYTELVHIPKMAVNTFVQTEAIRQNSVDEINKYIGISATA